MVGKVPHVHSLTIMYSTNRVEKIRSVVFGFLIVSVASFYGYYAKGGALDVGRASTQAVVSSSVSILIANFILTQIMLL